MDAPTIEIKDDQCVGIVAGQVNVFVSTSELTGEVVLHIASPKGTRFTLLHEFLGDPGTLTRVNNPSE